MQFIKDKFILILHAIRGFRAHAEHGVARLATDRGPAISTNTSITFIRGSHRRATALLTLAAIALFSGCSHTYIVVKDRDHMLRQDGAPMTVTLADSSKVRTFSWCHVFDESPEQLRAYVSKDYPIMMGLTDETISRMRMQDAGFDSSALAGQARRDQIASPLRTRALWCKGVRTEKDARKTEWSGGIPEYGILKVDIDDDRCVPLMSVALRHARRYEVLLRDESRLLIDSARFGVDSSILYLRKPGTSLRVATADILAIRRIVPFGLEALAIAGGAAAGVIVGGVIPAWATSALVEHQHSSGFQGLQEIVTVFFLGGTTGLVAGPIIGYSSLEESYVFAP
jgi:hypothetical protein